MDLKKAGCKKQGHCYSKREQACNNDPGFLHTAVCNPYFGPFFKVSDPKKISGHPDY